MITISNIAKNRIKDLIKNNGKAGYLYLQGGGCSGFEYKLRILEENKKQNKLDEIFKIDNYNLYLCGKSLLYLVAILSA